MPLDPHRPDPAPHLPDGRAPDPGTSHARLLEIQAKTFSFFVSQMDPGTGLVADSTEPGCPSSIAATGLGLACYPVGVERGLMERDEAARRTLLALRFAWDAPQGTAPRATGIHGFFYHFLDMADGRRAWECEVSTIDSALFIAGALLAAQYFDRDTPADSEIRALADRCYRRMDWAWARNGGRTVTHGWKPESGFIPYHWEGYCEALILYVLGLGSPTYPLPPDSYAAWTETYSWKEIYGLLHVYAGPLFIHQLSHCWLDLRSLRDAPMRDHGLDYFENSRRATLVQQQYAIRNPERFNGYGEHAWGVSAGVGPGPASKKIDGIERRFFGYEARGAPFGPDDGTLTPSAVVASLPFAPEIVLPTIAHFHGLRLIHKAPNGFEAAYNPTFGGDGEPGWVASYHYGINQGPATLMIENHLSGMPWALMRRCGPVVKGLEQAGFTGGWLER